MQRAAAGLDSDTTGFPGTPFYARIAQAYREGARVCFCAPTFPSISGGFAPVTGQAGARYFIAEQKEVDHRMEARASVAFDSTRSGIAGWLADPAPMGSLDYVSPDATLVASFVSRNPGAIVDSLTGILNHKASDLGAGGTAVQNELGASLGGEFTFAIRWTPHASPVVEAGGRSVRPC